MLYGLLAPFRADPLAASVERPWLFLADAIQRAVLTLAKAQWLWTAGKGSTGPLACAKVALRRAGVAANAGLTQLQSRLGAFTLWEGPSRPLQTTALPLFALTSSIALASAGLSLRPSARALTGPPHWGTCGPPTGRRFGRRPSGY